MEELRISDDPFVSIIVIVRDMAQTIDSCLRSVFSVDYPKKSYEVIVVDGGSTDGTLTKMQRYPIKCVHETRNGRGIARNTGIKNAKGELVVFLDADCVAYPNWLRKHVELHDALRTSFAIGGAVVCENDVAKLVQFRHYTYFANMCENVPRKVTWDIATCNASFKKKFFAKVGLFDEKLDFGEDTSLCWNALNKGYSTLFDPAPKVIHIYPPMTLRDFLDKKRNDGKSYGSIQIPYKIPKEYVTAALFVPLLYILKSLKDTLDLVRYLPSKKLLFTAFPCIFLGSAFWVLGCFDPVKSGSK